MSEKQTEVEIVTGVVLGPGRDGLPGDIVTLDDALAKQLISAGTARMSQGKKSKATEPAK